MSQFQRKSREATQVTTLMDLSQYKDLRNLLLTCRLGWVEEAANPAKKSKAGSVFSAVLILHDGIADLSVWDPEMIREWQKFVGLIVHIEGMSCSKRRPGSENFASAPGEYAFHVNKGQYTISVMKAMDLPEIPHNGKVPPMWLRSSSGCTPSDSVWTPVKKAGAGAGCCDAPNDITCRATGLRHRAICVVCRIAIDPNQPFCSKSVDGEKCKAYAQQTAPASPFREVDTKDAKRGRPDADLPSPKILKMDVQDFMKDCDKDTDNE